MKSTGCPASDYNQYTYKQAFNLGTGKLVLPDQMGQACEKAHRHGNRRDAQDPAVLPLPIFSQFGIMRDQVNEGKASQSRPKLKSFRVHHLLQYAIRISS